jgi:hypothetical protein
MLHIFSEFPYVPVRRFTGVSLFTKDLIIATVANIFTPAVPESIAVLANIDIAIFPCVFAVAIFFIVGKLSNVDVLGFMVHVCAKAVLLAIFELPGIFVPVFMHQFTVAIFFVILIGADVIGIIA